MNLVKDDFEIRKLLGVPGTKAPIYVMGLPEDLDKLNNSEHLGIGGLVWKE